MAKKKEEQNKAEENGQPLEALILDCKTARYPLVEMASRWAKVLERKQEYRHMQKNEILELALKEVLSEKVDRASIEKELKAMEEQAAKEAEKAKEKMKEELSLNEEEEGAKESKKTSKEAAAKK